MGGNYKASRLRKTTGYDPGIPTPRLRLATLPPYETKGLQEITTPDETYEQRSQEPEEVNSSRTGTR